MSSELPVIAKAAENLDPRLTHDLAAQISEELCELRARKVTGEPHRPMTCSRTKWRRMTLGAAPSSK